MDTTPTETGWECVWCMCAYVCVCGGAERTVQNLLAEAKAWWSTQNPGYPVPCQKVVPVVLIPSETWLQTKFSEPKISMGRINYALHDARLHKKSQLQHAERRLTSNNHDRHSSTVHVRGKGLERTLILTSFNPLIAPACKISGLKDAQTRLQIVYFPVL